MSTKSETQADALREAVAAPHVVDFESDESEFVDANDRLVQLRAGRPADSEMKAGTQIVEMPPDEPHEGDLRTAA